MAKSRKPGRQDQYASETYGVLLARVAGAVARLRAKHGWTQEEAAHNCAMSARLLQAIESQSTNLTMTTLARLCDGFQVDARQMFTPSRPDTRPRRPGRPRSRRPGGAG